MKTLLIFAVEFYRLALTPLRPLVGASCGCCRFTPTCSAYAVEALRHYGARHGLGMIARRLLRCHPWGAAGYDPVPVPVCRPIIVNRKF